MAPYPSNQTPDVSNQAPQPFEDVDAKHETSYIDMPLTPKASLPARAKSPAPSRFAVQSVHLRECFAEFLGTFVMILFGMGVNNQVTNSQDANGTWLSINMCWGIGVLIGVYCTEGISGAHLNTAVTLAHCVYGRLPWWKAPGYMLSQLLGAFCGAFVIYVMQYQNLNMIDPNRETTQSSFATYPSDNISNYTAFYTEVVGTGMLLLGIYAITDQRNRPAGPVGAPFAFCLLIMALGMCIGMNTGYAINPARDFGPRIFTSIAGWGSKVFTTRDHYFWIPIVGPLLGGVIGAGLYELLVEMHHPPQVLPLVSSAVFENIEMPTPSMEHCPSTTGFDFYESACLWDSHGYANMLATPKATDLIPVLSEKRTGLYRFAVQSVHLRECFAEFLGTYVMIVFGMGVNNQVTNSENANGTWLSINICWGIGVMIGVYCSEGVSGANLNTAVTLAHCVYGRLPWWKAPGYMISQVLAAFCGAFTIWVMQWQNLNAIDPNRETTQSSFATYPATGISNYTAFYTELIGTGMLVLSIYAITDKKNRPAGKYGNAFAFALMIMALGMAFGMNTGYAVNPARDFGPRLFTLCAGWGTKTFTSHHYYFWIPIVADLIGGVCGAGLYRILVEIHHPQTPLP
ncbi:hypothetical protein JM16_006196 [Phytophthora kernoviae]|uniref:Aquaporin n=3 Tax=Phytophthora kernoviae TaxID=325452 RepID=A0A8T0LU76_9STRA|nr:hypothetical protein JM16_006196 [Phytophthora kernoviae]